MPAHVIRTQVGRERGFMCRLVRHVCHPKIIILNVLCAPEVKGLPRVRIVIWFPTNTIAVPGVMFFVGICQLHASTPCLGVSGLQGFLFASLTCACCNDI